MTPPRTLYLLRHGEIVGHGERRLIGQLDVPLSPTGIRQAQWWRSQWAAISFERIVCSDLIRCRTTAEILGEGAHCPVETMRSLREIDLGQWEGLSRETIQSRFPDAWDARGKDMAEYRPPGGESFSDLSARVLPVFESIANGSDTWVLVVAHAAVNRVILCHVLGMSLGNLFRLGQDYAALSIIEFAERGWVVNLLNRTPEIPERESVLIERV